MESFNHFIAAPLEGIKTLKTSRFDKFFRIMRPRGHPVMCEISLLQRPARNSYELLFRQLSKQA